MNAPKHTVATANHGASGCSRIAVGRAGSRSNVTMTRQPPSSLSSFLSVTELLLVLTQNLMDGKTGGLRIPIMGS